MRDPSLRREARLGFVGWWAGARGGSGAFTLGSVVLWFPPLGLRLPVRVGDGDRRNEGRFCDPAPRIFYGWVPVYLLEILGFGGRE